MSQACSAESHSNWFGWLADRSAALVDPWLSPPSRQRAGRLWDRKTSGPGLGDHPSAMPLG